MSATQSMDYFRYLTATDGDKLWGLYVTGVGCLETRPGEPYPPGVHPDTHQFRWPQKRVLPEYQLLYIPVGEGEFESESAGRLPIKSGSVLLTFPGDWHRYHPAQDADWQEYWVGFRGEIADMLAQRGILSCKRPLLHTGQCELIQHAFGNLLEWVREEPPGFQQLLAAGTIEILGAAVAAERVRPTGGRHLQAVQEAKLLLAGDGELMAIDKIAARLHLSEAQFRRVFRQYTGLSPYQYYQQARINRAKELLSGSTLSVKEIAAALGFENQYHFSKVFKNRTGMSPSQWRHGD